MFCIKGNEYFHFANVLLQDGVGEEGSGKMKPFSDEELIDSEVRHLHPDEAVVAKKMKLKTTEKLKIDNLTGRCQLFR